MPKIPQSVTITAKSLTEGVRYPREGFIVDGTEGVLCVVEYVQGFVIYHTPSGLCLGSNLDNPFKSEDKAHDFARKFWIKLSRSSLSVKIYREATSRDMLLTSTPKEAQEFARARTNRKK